MNNKTFKTVWNCARRCYVAVNEKKNNAVKSSGKALLTVVVMAMPFVAVQAGVEPIDNDEEVSYIKLDGGVLRLKDDVTYIGRNNVYPYEFSLEGKDDSSIVFSSKKAHKITGVEKSEKTTLDLHFSEITFSGIKDQAVIGDVKNTSGLLSSIPSEINLNDSNIKIDKYSMEKNWTDIHIDSGSTLTVNEEFFSSDNNTEGNTVVYNDGKFVAKAVSGMQFVNSNECEIGEMYYRLSKAERLRINDGVAKLVENSGQMRFDSLDIDLPLSMDDLVSSEMKIQMMEIYNTGRIEVAGDFSAKDIYNAGIINAKKKEMGSYFGFGNGRLVLKSDDKLYFARLTDNAGIVITKDDALSDSEKSPDYGKAYLKFSGSNNEVESIYWVGEDENINRLIDESEIKIFGSPKPERSHLQGESTGILIGSKGLMAIDLRGAELAGSDVSEEKMQPILFKVPRHMDSGYNSFKLFHGAEVRFEHPENVGNEEKKVVLARGFVPFGIDEDKGTKWADGVEFSVADENGYAYEVTPQPLKKLGENGGYQWAVTFKRLSMAESYPDILLPGVFVKQPDGSVKDAHQLIKELKDVPGDLTYIQGLLKNQDLKPAERVVIMNKIAMTGALGGVAQSTQGAAGMIVDGVYGHFDRIDVKSNNLWVDVLGSVNNGKSDAYSLPVGEMGLKSTKTGIVMGYDMPVAEDLVAGVSLSYLHDKLEGKGYGSADNKADTFGASLYADWKAADNIDLGAQVVYLHTTNKVKLDAAGQKVEAKPKTNAVVASLRASMDVPVDAFTITPHAGIDVVHARTGSYDTKLDGKALWNNKIESRTTVELPVGVSASTTFEKSGWTFSPKADLTVSTVLGSRDAKYTITGVSGYSNSFEARYTGRCSVKAGLGLRAENASGLSVAGFYDAVKSKNGLDNRVRIELRQSF